MAAIDISRKVTLAAAISVTGIILYKQISKSVNKYKILSTTDNLEKSQSDDRNYRIITLSNKLECILISDPTTKAACALCTKVGNLEDPEDLEGLAHFLEHMMFIASAKYPKDSEYKQFMKDHGGRPNAWTGIHDTTFAFDIDNNYLYEAMDRMAQFFICPLLTESVADRELNTVNSEFTNGLQKDSKRLYQFSRSLAKPSHPWHKWGVGNIQSLKENVPSSVNVRDELRLFHKKYYSSSIMKLAVVGKESLDELQDMVNKIFSPIINKGISTPKYSEDVFENGKFPVLYKLVPIKEMRELRLNWIMPNMDKYGMEQPCALLKWCMNDQAKGSILALLKEKGYATWLTASIQLNTAGHTRFRCYVYLTQKGLENWTEIVDIIYQYIAKMKILSNEHWKKYFDQNNKRYLMNFNFKTKSKPRNYVVRLSRKLHHENIPRELFLKYDYGMGLKYDYNLIRKYLSYLSVDNCYYQLIAKDFKDEVDQNEKWYGTQYKEEKIDDKILNRWRESEYKNDNNELWTPLKNQYIADNFSICCDDEKKEENVSKEPHIVREGDNYKIWYKMDDIFKKPKLCITIMLRSQFFCVDTVSSYLTTLIVDIFKDELNDLAYTFKQASINYAVWHNGGSVIVFKFNGYSQKLHLLVETVLDRFRSFKITKEKYEIHTEALHRGIISIKKYQPNEHCNHVASIFLTENSSIQEKEDAFKNITYDALLKHQQNTIYQKVYVEALIYGNVNKHQCDNMYIPILDKYVLNEIQEPYIIKEVYSDQKGCLKLPQNGDNYLCAFKSPNEEDQNSAIACNYLYKSDDKDGINFVTLDLFTQLCNAPCFENLRTKQQLGYIVRCKMVSIAGFLAFKIVIQSNNSNPRKLNHRIEVFLEGFRDFIVEMDDKTFITNRQSIINDYLLPKRSINGKNGSYWGEIEALRYQFNRNENVSQQIEKLTKNDVLEFYDEYIAKNGKSRCKLTIQCFGNKHDINCKDSYDDDDSQYQDDNVKQLNISNIEDIQNKFGYHPYPYIDNL